jgi:uncharacterized protein
MGMGKMEQQIRQKNKMLGDLLRDMGRLMVAFSGGVDSAFLLARAKEELGDNVLAVIAASETFPQREFDEAVRLAKEIDVPHMTITIKEFENENFVSNPVNRCYFCRVGLYEHLTKLALEKGHSYIVDGTNASDVGDYRPGMKALKEKGVRSPLKEAGLTKDDIRILSKEMNLKTWNKPSFACLSSRIPYGTRITADKINQLDEAENYLLQDIGLYQVRVRHHDKIARIEVDPEDMELVLHHRKAIESKLKSLGFLYVALDLTGYSTGSMNKFADKATLPAN